MSFPQRQRAKPARREEIEQARFVRWSHLPEVRAVMPGLRWLHHSPNGGQRDAFTGAQMKALGVKPGFPDLILPVRTTAHVGLVIEMKTEIGRTSTLQDEWLEHLQDNGWLTTIARSAHDARFLTCLYLGLDPAIAPPLREE